MSVVRDGPSSRVPLFVGYRVAGAVRLRTSALSPMRNEFVTCCTVACRPSISFATSLLASSSAPLAMPWFPAPFPSSLPASPPLQCLGSRFPFPQRCGLSSVDLSRNAFGGSVFPAALRLAASCLSCTPRGVSIIRRFAGSQWVLRYTIGSVPTVWFDCVPRLNRVGESGATPL